MNKPQPVSQQQWLTARKVLLEQEKALTRLRDEVAEQRRALPCTEVLIDYSFTGPAGDKTLAELFQGRSQLLIYHFMYGPDWQAGCKSCSYLADHFDAMLPHLQARDVSMAVISRAPIDTLSAFKQRMGWQFDWLSSVDNTFNRDFHVSFTEREQRDNRIYYNYNETNYFSSEAPGLSVFYRDDDGTIYHTYSCYARGLDMLIGTYNFLDLVPKGRDEGDLPFGMAWVNYHDSY